MNYVFKELDVSSKYFYKYCYSLSRVNFVRNTCVFDLNWLKLTVPLHGEIRNYKHFLRFSNVIDISHDRFLSDKHGGKEHTSPVKKEVLSRRIIQKEVLFTSL